jgi:hypothetical protein
VALVTPSAGEFVLPQFCISAYRKLNIDEGGVASSAIMSISHFVKIDQSAQNVKARQEWRSDRPTCFPQVR